MATRNIDRTYSFRKAPDYVAQERYSWTVLFEGTELGTAVNPSAGPTGWKDWDAVNKAGKVVGTVRTRVEAGHLLYGQGSQPKAESKPRQRKPRGSRSKAANLAPADQPQPELAESES